MFNILLNCSYLSVFHACISYIWTMHVCLYSTHTLFMFVFLCLFISVLCRSFFLYETGHLWHFYLFGGHISCAFTSAEHLFDWIRGKWLPFLFHPLKCMKRNWEKISTDFLFEFRCNFVYIRLSSAVRCICMCAWISFAFSGKKTTTHWKQWCAFESMTNFCRSCNNCVSVRKQCNVDELKTRSLISNCFYLFGSRRDGEKKIMFVYGSVCVCRER